MVRSREVVSESLRAVPAQEDGSRVLYLAEPFERVIDAELEVLRCYLIGYLYCLPEVLSDYDLAVVVY